MGRLGLCASVSPSTARLSRPSTLAAPSFAAPRLRVGPARAPPPAAAAAGRPARVLRPAQLPVALPRAALRQPRPASGSTAVNSEALPLATMDATGEPTMQTMIDNTTDPACSTIRVAGPGQSDCLLLLVNGLFSEGFKVLSSNYNNNEGMVEFTMRVVAEDNRQLSEEEVAEVRELIDRIVSTSNMSVRPAIYGMVAEKELERLTSAPSGLVMSDALDLERKATEMAVAAARFVASERKVQSAVKKEDAAKVASAEQARSEAASVLERTIAAIEAMITSRRIISSTASAPPEEPKSAADLLKQQMLGQAAAPQQAGTGPGAGSGFEILLQGFNWESHKKDYYKEVVRRAKEWAEEGFTAVWMPPPSDSVSPQGYLPRDLYLLDSAYGTESELREALAALHEHGLKAIADIVVNHRCAHFQGSDGKWNKFGGRLAWDASAICNNNPAWGGRGAHKTGEDYPAAPNLDHTQERIRNDITGWLQYLKTVGFDGWRFDFVRGYGGQYVKQYIDATVPQMAFGEYWDSCDYSDRVLNYNQDGHRQRTINWCDSTGGTAAAFDFTTKGVLQEALGRNELWRLSDAQGRPPGMLGMWSSRAITFIDNHDTGSTLNHWPFPSHHLQEGYAYILLHPGTPCVLIDHISGDGKLRKLILDLVQVRKDNGLNARTKVTVRKVAGDVYAATFDDKVALKIGRGDWSPNGANVNVGQKEWKLTVSGQNVAVWVAVM